MAGTLVPLVLIPRYTTVAGDNTYTTIGMDVTEYEKAIVSFWLSNGIALAVPADVTVTFQESTDQLTWTTCTGGPYTSPALGTETQFQPELTKRWFRISIALGIPDSAVTLWCIGFLMQRES